MGAAGSKSSYNCIKSCTLWKADRSPACRAVMMALDAMELSITEVDVDIDKGDHRNQGITVMNPLQTLPVFKDREMILHDSHAICAYLASRYRTSSHWYPKDPGARALVHQQMSYNCGVLYPRYRSAVDPILYENCNFVMPQQMNDIECAYADLELLLGRQHWFGGSLPTLGDITIGATISTLNALVPISTKKYPRLSTWHSRLAEQSFYTTANRKGLYEFVQRIDSCDETDNKNEFKCPRGSEKRRLVVETMKTEHQLTNPINSKVA